MKTKLTLLLFYSFVFGAMGQTTSKNVPGKVSYVSTQNVYVKFENTDGIHEGDTLFIEKNGVLIPAMKVNNKSSISCVGTPINGLLLTLSTDLISKQQLRVRPDKIRDNEAKTQIALAVNDEAINAAILKAKNDSLKQHITGRVSLSSYGEHSSDYLSSQRFRYSFNLNAEHIDDTKLSAEVNMTFTNTYVPQHNIELPYKIITDPTGVKPDSVAFADSTIQGKWKNKNFYIYSLALTYDLTKTSTVSIGRKLNINLANIGAVDGVQYTKRFDHISLGAVVGTRPDFYDYSFNSKLFQYGAFVGHNIDKEKYNEQTTLAFFNQTNSGKTDRRFAYLQHHSSFNRKIDLFCSFETDFYTLENNQPKSIFDLTSTFVSLNYQPWNRLSLGLSYDARKNVYYYESFRNKADSIYDKETRQGLRFNFNYRPLRYLYWGGNVGYRFKQKSDSIASINAYTYLNYSDVPLIHASFNVNATLLKTNNLNGTIYGASLSRDLFWDKLYAEIGYRMVDYQFKQSDSTLHQDIFDLSLSYMFSKRLILSGDYEYTKEDTSNHMNSLFLNLTCRF